VSWGCSPCLRCARARAAVSAWRAGGCAPVLRSERYAWLQAGRGAGGPGGRRAARAVRTDDGQLARLEPREQLLVARRVDVAKEPAPPRAFQLRKPCRTFLSALCMLFAVPSGRIQVARIVLHGSVGHAGHAGAQTAEHALRRHARPGMLLLTPGGGTYTHCRLLPASMRVAGSHMRPVRV